MGILVALALTLQSEIVGRSPLHELHLAPFPILLLDRPNNDWSAERLRAYTRPEGFQCLWALFGMSYSSNLFQSARIPSRFKHTNSTSRTCGHALVRQTLF